MPTENKPANPGFDLNTPDGGRGYISDLFKSVLKRHDYRQYISERLADDFACTLAQHFEDIKAREQALQLRLNAADQRIDELAQHQAEPVNWAAPKTVRQLIQQLQTLDPELEIHAMLRIPDYKDGKQVRSCPLSISYERMEGPWLSSYKGDGRKVIAIWAKPDPREPQDQGETLTEFAESR